MPFFKVVKTSAYYSRFQTKFKRRILGKTDYKARKALIIQDRNKYATPKYRLVVRRTNKRIICQLIYATIKGDRVKCEAQSTELANYGLKAGLTNYPAAYCTGLLLARRLLKEHGLDQAHVGVAEADGEEYHIESEDLERRPFKALLDVGLIRTTTGNRSFGAMKGAVDGGIYVPHSTKRFPGAKGDNYDAEGHAERIFGGHVKEYMDKLKEKGGDAFKKQFNGWQKKMDVDNISSLKDLYKKVHAAIRKDPARKKAAAKKPVRKQKKAGPGAVVFTDSKGRRWKHEFRRTPEDRKTAVAKKIEKFVKDRK